MVNHVSWPRVLFGHNLLHMTSLAKFGLVKLVPTSGAASRLFRLALNIALGLIVGLLLARTIASLWLPFGWDHGIMAEVGHVYLEGGLPYRDAWDMKGPAAFFGFALAEAMFGRTMWSVRIVDLAIIISTAALLGKFIAERLAARYAIWGVVAFLLAIYSNGWFYTAQPEGWAAAASTFAILPILDRSRNPRWPEVAFSGFMIAVCSLLKPLYVLFGLVPLILLLRAELTLGQRYLRLAIFAISAALPVVFIVMVYLAEGALSYLVDVHVVYSSTAYSSMSDLNPNVIFKRLSTNFAAHAPERTTITAITFLMPLIIYGLWMQRSKGNEFMVLLSWLGIAIFCVIVQGKFYVYHWLPLFPPAIVLTVIGASGCFRSTHRRVIRSSIAIGCFGAFLLLTIPATAQEAFWTARYLIGDISRHEYYAFFQHNEYNADDQVRAAEYLRTHAYAGDLLFVWGRDATVNYLSGLKSPSRFVFALPLTRGKFLNRYRSEAIRALMDKKPRFILVGTPNDIGKRPEVERVENIPYLPNEEKYYFVGVFPEFARILGNDYTYTARFGNLDIFERIPKAKPNR